MTRVATRPGGEQEDAAALIQARLRGAVRYNEWIHSLISPFVGRRIPDAGCGIGNVTRLFLDHAERLIGYERRDDFCDALCRDLGGHSNFRVMQGDLRSLPTAELQQEDLDTVLCINVLEHIDQDIELLRQFKAILTPGGRVCLFVPAHPWLYGAHDAADGHYRRYTKRRLRDALKAAELTIETLRWVNLPGIAGWWINKIRRCDSFGESQCGAFERIIPVVARLESLCRPPVGLSLLAVGRKDASHGAQAGEGVSR